MADGWRRVRHAVAVPPSGTVTLLYTDIEGSTTLWDRYPGAMKTALGRHDEIIRDAIDSAGGYIFNAAGDAFHAAFGTPSIALDAAIALQRRMVAEPWGVIGRLRVRLALHVGEVEVSDGEYFGQPLNRVERLLRAASGGQSLISQPTFELIRDTLPDDVILRDLGEHQLQDLTRAEHIYQIAAPDLPSDFPALRTLDQRPNNLPIQTTTLIGRQSDVTAVVEMLRDPRRRLITLKGPGGIGKTRLSFQIAAEALDDFADGVWVVSLAQLVDPNEVVPAICQSLGCPEKPGQTPLENLRDLLRSRQILLVLDNFEHLLPAGSIVAELLRTSPNLKVLATSRSLLHLLGEHVYDVQPLDVPILTSRRIPKRLAQYPSVQLFVERAQSARADFRITEENATDIAETCIRLEGVPLAIELAAGRSRLLTPRALLNRLQSRLPVLTRGTRDGPARHQTLRNTIAWSFDLLDPSEQALFRRLAVFAGGFSIDAALAIGSVPHDLDLDLLDGLDSLVGKSLVRQDDVDGEPRLTMLETIREFGRERLDESGDQVPIVQAHASWFLAFADEALREWFGPQQSRWLTRLERENPNFRAALDWVTSADDAAIGLPLGAALWRFWATRGYFTEGRARLDAILTLPSAAVSSRERANALNGAGNLAYFQGDHAAARSLHAEALAIRRNLNDPAGIAESLNNLGSTALLKSDYPAAHSLSEESLTIGRRLGVTVRIGSTLNNLGIVARELGDFPAARSLLEESLAIWRRLGDQAEIATALENLAVLDLRRGEFTAVAPRLRESLALLQAIGHNLGTVSVIEDFAHLAAVQGQPSRALVLAAAASAWRASASAPRLPADAAQLDRLLADCRALLSPLAADHAWDTGLALSLDETYRYALSDDNTPR